MVKKQKNSEAMICQVRNEKNVTIYAVFETAITGSKKEGQNDYLIDTGAIYIPG